MVRRSGSGNWHRPGPIPAAGSWGDAQDGAAVVLASPSRERVARPPCPSLRCPCKRVGKAPHYRAADPIRGSLRGVDYRKSSTSRGGDVAQRRGQNRGSPASHRPSRMSFSPPVRSCPKREIGTTRSEGAYFGALQAHATTGVAERGDAQEAGALPIELAGHAPAGQWVGAGGWRALRSPPAFESRPFRARSRRTLVSGWSIVPARVPDAAAVLGGAARSGGVSIGWFSHSSTLPRDSRGLNWHGRAADDGGGRGERARFYFFPNS